MPDDIDVRSDNRLKQEGYGNSVDASEGVSDPSEHP